MVGQASILPFFLMDARAKFFLGRLPDNLQEQIAGLQKAIKNTKKTKAEYEANGDDTTELESHLKGLEQFLEKIKKQDLAG